MLQVNVKETVKRKTNEKRTGEIGSEWTKGTRGKVGRVA